MLNIDPTLKRRFSRIAAAQRRLTVSRCSELAAAQTEPALWVEGLFSAVHRRLDSSDADCRVREAARQQLALIRDDLLRQVALQRRAA